MSAPEVNPYAPPSVECWEQLKVTSAFMQEQDAKLHSLCSGLAGFWLVVGLLISMLGYGMAPMTLVLGPDWDSTGIGNAFFAFLTCLLPAASLAIFVSLQHLAAVRIGLTLLLLVTALILFAALNTLVQVNVWEAFLFSILILPLVPAIMQSFAILRLAAHIRKLRTHAMESEVSA